MKEDELIKKFYNNEFSNQKDNEIKKDSDPDVIAGDNEENKNN